MKKIGLICALLMLCGGLTACAKKINGEKAYKANITSTSKVSGKCSELIEIKGTTSAPDGYEVVAVKNDGKDDPVCNNRNMKNYVQVKKGKFTGYIDPLQYNSNVKKGTNLKYHFAAVKNVKRLGNKDKKAIKEKFESNSIKLSFNPATEFVQSNVQKVLGSGAIVTKKSKTVYAIMPKKDSNFEDKVSQSMYGDKNQWADITKQINRLSAKIKTPAGRVALVLMNPENHKKFLFVSIGGKTKFDAITSGTVNSDATKASNIKSTNEAANSGSSSGDEDSDGDDFELGVILGWLMAYDDEYGDDSDVDTNTDTNNSDNDNYTDNDSDDYSYDNSDDYDDSSSDDQSQSSSTGPAAQPDTDDDDSFAY